MTKVLVLGAGMVSRPLVSHLLRQPNLRVRVGDINPANAQRVVAGHPQGEAFRFDVNDKETLHSEVAQADITVSILQAPFHPLVAAACIEGNTHLVTSSYASPAIRAFDAAAREKGLIFLMELGLDPGIDHMSAMQIINEVHRGGGKVTSFSSYCGGLPAPEDNDNPFGYKLSWAPESVFRAMTSDAVFLRDGINVTTPNAQLFSSPTHHVFEGIGTLEGYPNRDSLSYVGLYGIPEVSSMIRGTLRYPGWSAFWERVSTSGILSEAQTDLSGLTFAEFTSRLVSADGEDPATAFAKKIGVDVDSPIIDKCRWLGLFSSDPVPQNVSSPLGALSQLAKQRMQYAGGQKDMVVLQHKFGISLDGKREVVTSTLIDFGIPYGDTSMARTVGNPAAIGTMLVADGKIPYTGVVIPTIPEVYDPVLRELASIGIKMQETTEILG